MLDFTEMSDDALRDVVLPEDALTDQHKVLKALKELKELLRRAWQDGYKACRESGVDKAAKGIQD